ncbi:MAG: hypothetical protein KDJ52_10005 [Anaerolineae bacterium]|nr:hypothetical protein [Anaerolineae bacterium]
MYYPILRPKAQRQLKNIGRADLVIGLPSYKNPQRAAYVTHVALKGLRQYYPQLRTVLINADAGQKATTRQAVVAQAGNNGHSSLIVSSRYEGVLGQGSACAALLDAALALDAKAIVILDSYKYGINTNWIPGLAHLILEDKADVVIPRYRRWLTVDGLMNDLIAYPLLRALWGRSIRHPIGSDLALSPKLASAILDEDVWGTSVARFGFSPWLASYSTLSRWRVAQSALGEKTESKNPSEMRTTKKLDAQFRDRFYDVSNVLFRLIAQHEPCWQKCEPINSVPTLTHFASQVTADDIIIEDTVQLLDNLALGWIEYRKLWQTILAPDNLAHIEALASLQPDRFHFPADLWAKIIYDFATVFNKGEVDPDQVVNALYPLYQGRHAAFSQEVAGLAFVGREGTVAAQAVEFEETRSYLKDRWYSYRL